MASLGDISQSKQMVISFPSCCSDGIGDRDRIRRECRLSPSCLKVGNSSIISGRYGAIHAGCFSVIRSITHAARRLTGSWLLLKIENSSLNISGFRIAKSATWSVFLRDISTRSISSSLLCSAMHKTFNRGSKLQTLRRTIFN